MHSNKVDYQTSIDLSLYIESLLNTDDQEIEIQNKIEEKIETIIFNDLVVAEIEERVLKTEEKAEVQIAEVSPQIPAWGKEPFKCLLVKAAGMDLMVPAMSISYIERVNKKIIRLPLDVEAFRGVLTLRERSVAVIDMLALISENGVSIDKSSIKIDEQHIDYVIVMDEGDYALACDDVGEMVLLETESVRWNKASFNNPMFAGVVPEYLCPIVNIENIQQQVKSMPFVQSLNSNY
jgi:purine-binding chemotaxis protein CheW